MLMIKSARVRVFLLLVVAISATVSAVWYLQKRFGYGPYEEYVAKQQAAPGPLVSELPSPSLIQSPPAAPAATSAADLPALDPSPEPTQITPTLTLEPSYVGRLKLALPVNGVKPEQLLDTFKDARSEGRVHDAIDITAPVGTPVIAAAEGDIIKLSQSERGGITIYQASVDKKLIFYYAHLQGYAEGLVVGKRVWQGETIGYVGDTGNAGSGNYHLHFSIMITKDPKRYWEGTNINPYPLLRN
jgi:murein DD-endopeptidase MepM/ murein hydrolase activator NlpD